MHAAIQALLHGADAEEPTVRKPTTLRPVDEAVALHSTGSGFFVAERIVVTNFHVVEGASRLQVTWGQTTVAARVAIKDKANDLALLEIFGEETSLPPLPVGVVRDIAEGEAVITIGYPLSGVLGARPRITDGIVSSATGLDDDPRVCQISVPILPGNSGAHY